MVAIDYVATIPERDDILHVGLRGVDADGQPLIREVPVRKAYFEALKTEAKRLAYVQEAAEYHHPASPAQRKARRAAWDAADNAEAAAAAKAKAEAEEAKFIVVPQGFISDKEGAVTSVRVSITHHGLTTTATIPADSAAVEANARAAFAEYEAARQAAQDALAAFAVEK